jgi:hypothetical protein
MWRGYPRALSSLEHVVTDIEEVKGILRQILTTTSEPELGARLKQRLRGELARRGAPPFDERGVGYRKFSDFLEAFPEEFELIRSHEPGDLRVRLRSGMRPTTPPVAPLLVTLPKPNRVGDLPRVENEIWQAFTNPDPRRRRFLHLTTGKVSHYLNDEGSRFRSEVEQAPQQFIEVSPVPPEDQLAWMREYVEALALPTTQADPLLRLAGGPYTSQLNTVFSSALGDFGMGWRRRRAARVYEHIEAWAKKNSFDLRLLVEAPSEESQSFAGRGVSVEGQPDVAASRGAARERVIQLVGMLSDQDVEELVLPFLLTTIWITTRRSP